MTTVTKKIAVIINGDAESRHLENVDRALRNVLHPKGYETYVASPFQPSAPTDHYFSEDRAGVLTLLDQLSSRTDTNVELVLYITGHGGEEGFCLKSDCKTEDLLARIAALRYDHKRVVVMDQCYGGGLGKLFLNDPKTLFTAAGSRGEVDSCEDIAPRLWSPAKEVPDKNKDGVISWEERYDYAVAERNFNSEPQYVPSPGYVEEGKHPFPSAVQMIKEKTALDKALRQLHSGQYAIITFATSWCKPCREYAPKFDRMANSSGGQLLWIRTENESLAQQWGVREFPTVMIVSAKGNRRVIEKRDDVLEELAQFEVSLEERLTKKIDVAEKIKDKRERMRAFCDIVISLVEAKPDEKQKAIFDKMIARGKKEKDEALGEALEVIPEMLAVRGEGDDGIWVLDKMLTVMEGYDYDIKKIAESLVRAKLSDKAEEFFDKFIGAAERIQNSGDRAEIFANIGAALAHAHLTEKALQVFGKAMIEVETFRDGDPPSISRDYTLIHVAQLLAVAELGKKGEAIFDSLIGKAEKINNEVDRVCAFQGIAKCLAQAQLDEKAVLLSERAITLTKSIKNSYDQKRAMEFITNSLRSATQRPSEILHW